MARVPKTSGSRTALEVAAAMQRVVDRAAAPDDGEPQGLARKGLGPVLRDLATIMRGAKELQGYQVEEVIEHVTGLAGVSVTTARSQGILPPEDDGPVGSADASGEDGS